jgi:hypothetical protein
MITRAIGCFFGTSLIAAFAVAAPDQSLAASAELTTLVNFSNTNIGPEGSFVADANGNLFGVTLEGNPGNNGTVFEIPKTASGYASTPITLVSFNGTDGMYPSGTLVIDANGNLFGTTVQGGNGGLAYGYTYGAGTVFEVVKTASGYSSVPTTLYNFCAQANCTDGAGPLGNLYIDSNGNLFGTTQSGGGYNSTTVANEYYGGGTIFEIAKTASGYATTPTILYSFCAQTNCTDGLGPAGLIADANGNLFGTTYGGGANYELASGGANYALSGGAVFELAKTAAGYASTPTILYSFCSQTKIVFNNGFPPWVLCTDGEDPGGAPGFIPSGLTADTNGNLFGTAAYGGGYNSGTIFEIAKTASGYASLVTILNFDGTNGRNPIGPLLIDAKGDLFGGSYYGESAYPETIFGNIFELPKTAAGYKSTPITLVNFDATNGSFPAGGLIADANGNLLGATMQGGAYGCNGNCLPGYGYGTAFEITDSGFVVTTTFAGTPGKPGCYVNSRAVLLADYGGFHKAAVALGYRGVPALVKAITSFCWST